MGSRIAESLRSGLAYYKLAGDVLVFRIWRIGELALRDVAVGDRAPCQIQAQFFVVRVFFLGGEPDVGGPTVAGGI